MLQHAPGFRSLESKKALHRTAWVGAVLIGLLQLVVPVAAVVWALVHAFLGALTTPSPDVQAPAYADRHLLYTVPIREEGANVFEPEQRRTLVRVALDDDATPESIVELAGGDDPHLLAVGDTVWAIDEHGVAIIEGADVRSVDFAEPLPSRMWPLVIDGAPAVVAMERTGDAYELTLRTFASDRFVASRVATTTLPFDANEMRAVMVGDDVHVFVDGYGEPVHAATWDASGMSDWTRTPIEHAEWTAVALDGAAVVMELDDGGETPSIVGWRESSGWRKFVTVPAEAAYAIGAASVADDRIAVTTDTTLDGVAVTVFDPRGGAERHEHAASTLMGEVVGVVVLGQIAPVLLTGLLALVLASRMRVHRIGEYTMGPRVARYASLGRRVLARSIDGAIGVVAPLAVLVARVLDDPASIDEGSMIAVCLLWSVPVGIALTVLEGKFGQTPGKRLLGIRVVGLDLRAPGIGAAFVRGLLGIADGFFDGLVGIVAVATTPHWQRIGDLVARTIVIQDEPRRSVIQDEPRRSVIQDEPRRSVIQDEPRRSVIEDARREPYDGEYQLR